MSEERDIHYMRRAIELAQRGLYSTTPNPRVGCVLVREGTVISEGFHRQAGGPHAEIVALQDTDASGASAYVSLEPCNHQGRTGACTEALIQAGVSEVIYGMRDPNPKVAGSGIARLQQAGVRVRGPVCEQEALALNPGFIKRMTLNRPFVRCKLAMSLDARTAMGSGESKWITGSAARLDVQRLRAQSCAIITGADTVLADNPAMTVRALGVDGEEFAEHEFGENPRQPLRVVIDSQRRVALGAKIFQAPGRAIIATVKPSDDECVYQLPASDRKVDLDALLKHLAVNEINEVMLECGPSLAGAFLRRGLIDELVVYIAGKILGSSARPLFKLPIESLADGIDLNIRSIEPVGDDIKLIADIKK